VDALSTELRSQNLNGLLGGMTFVYDGTILKFILTQSSESLNLSILTFAILV